VIGPILLVVVVVMQMTLNSEFESASKASFQIRSSSRENLCFNFCDRASLPPGFCHLRCSSQTCAAAERLNKLNLLHSCCHFFLIHISVVHSLVQSNSITFFILDNDVITKSSLMLFSSIPLKFVQSLVFLFSREQV